MRILLINHYAGSPYHGMEFRPFYLGREWIRMGHPVTILAASASHLRRKAPQVTGAITRESIEGIEYRWLQTPAYGVNGIKRALNMAAFVGQLYRYGAKLKGACSPDVVIASSTYPLDILPAMQIARRFSALLVFEVHDLWPLSPMQLGGMPWWHPFILVMQAAENLAYRKADVVVSLLPEAERHMRRHGLADGKFHFIPNGVDIAAWGSDAAKLPRGHLAALDFASRNGFFKIAYTGAHGIANALHTLLDAAALMREKPVAFFSIGDGPEKKKLEALSKSKKLAKVFFLPAVPKGCMPTLLGRMDALYIGLQRQPLFQFGVSPNKLLEYMMAAKPIICAIAAGNDMVAEARCGMSVPPEDPHGLAAAIGRLSSMPPRAREAMGGNGRAYVSCHHDYRVLAKKFMDLIVSNGARHRSGNRQKTAEICN
jgi:glycosyltransferase involved in cell wall biosynthesis